MSTETKVSVGINKATLEFIGVCLAVLGMVFFLSLGFSTIIPEASFVGCFTFFGSIAGALLSLVGLFIIIDS